MATWAQWFKFDNFTTEKYGDHIVKLSSLNNCAEVALLNSDFFKQKNDDFYLKSQKNHIRF